MSSGVFSVRTPAKTVPLPASLAANSRIIGDRFNTEVGVIGVAGGGEAFCCLPLINFSWAFGR